MKMVNHIPYVILCLVTLFVILFFGFRLSVCLLSLCDPARLPRPRIISFRSQELSFPLGPPPPPPDFALPKPLPGALQGSLQPVSDMQTLGPLAHSDWQQASGGKGG